MITDCATPATFIERKFCAIFFATSGRRGGEILHYMGNIIVRLHIATLLKFARVTCLFLHAI